MSSEPILWSVHPEAPLDRPSNDPIPAAGVMFHLLGAVALGWSALIWVVLMVIGLVSASPLSFALASAGLIGSGAWARWLIRVTEARADADVDRRLRVVGDDDLRDRLDVSS